MRYSSASYLNCCETNVPPSYRKTFSAQYSTVWSGFITWNLNWDHFSTIWENFNTVSMEESVYSQTHWQGLSTFGPNLKPACMCREWSGFLILWMKCQLRFLPPPLLKQRYGNLQTFPRPTAQPMPASVNSICLLHVGRLGCSFIAAPCVIIVARLDTNSMQMLAGI